MRASMRLFWLLMLLIGHSPVLIAAPALERIDIQTSQGRRAAFIHKPAIAPSTLVVLLHAAGSGPEQLRANTNYGFERLAHEAGWLVVYAAGFGKSWNDCRRTQQLDARIANIDDVAFLGKLIRELRDRYSIQDGRTLLGGYGNGAHMAIRMALERPDLIDGMFAVGGQLPVGAESVCGQSPRPLNALLITNTSRPGAQESDSAESTARYFANLAGYPGPGVKAPVSSPEGDATSGIEARRWLGANKAVVELYTARESILNGSELDAAQAAYEFTRLWSKPVVAQWQQATARQRERLEDCMDRQRQRRPSACLRPLELQEASQLVASF